MGNISRTGALVAFLALSISVGATDFYVSTAGLTNADGSFNNPWNLETALYPTAPVKAGDTIWMRGGEYVPSQSTYPAFESYLGGSSNAPIVVRPYPGERVVLREHPHYTGTDDQTILYVYGSNTWFWGLEVASLSTTRVTAVAGPDPLPSQLPLPSGVQVRGPNVKLINLTIHDTRGGLGLWQEAVNLEVNGCLDYNNGWKEAAGGGHGHGAYCQNSNGVMRLSNNIIFNQFANGIQGYTLNSQVRNLYIDHNAIFGNARIANYPQNDTGEQLVFGGAARIVGLKLFNNCIYQDLSMNGVTVRTDFGQNSNSDVTIGGNYIAGGSGGGNFQTSSTVYDSVIFTNNTCYSNNGGLFELTYLTQTNYIVDSNAYYGDTFQNFYNNGTKYYFPGWQAATGFDSHSSYQTNSTPPNSTFVYPNAYDSKRANIIVYNWADSNNVSVDVSSVLSTGDVYEVRNGQNFLAPPVLVGTYNGNPISLPMTNLTVATPNGWTNAAAVPTTGTKFNVFVLTGATPPQIAATSVLTNGNVLLQFTGSVSNWSYEVETSTDFVSWATIGVPSNAPAGSASYQFIDTGAAGARRFYKVKAAY